MTLSILERPEVAIATRKRILRTLRFLLLLAVVGALNAMLTLYEKTGVAFASEAFGTRIALLLVVSIFVAFLVRESRQALDAPRLGLDLYRNLFELNPVYVFLCDRRLRILQVNPLVQAGLGYTPGRLRGRPLAERAGRPDRVGAG